MSKKVHFLVNLQSTGIWVDNFIGAVLQKRETQTERERSHVQPGFSLVTYPLMV